jgi:hypothetical protein
MQTIKRIAYLASRRYSIGVYVDAMGYAITLMQVDRIYIPMAIKGKTFLERSKEEYQEAERYRLVDGMLSIDKSELSIKTICNSIEVLIGKCEDTTPTIYHNPSKMLAKTLSNQKYSATLKEIAVDPEEARLIINCLLTDGILSITNDSNLQARYNRELVNYNDPREVNHALFSLALNLDSFASGDANWVRSLANIQYAVYEL